MGQTANWRNQNAITLADGGARLLRNGHNRLSGLSSWLRLSASFTYSWYRFSGRVTMLKHTRNNVTIRRPHNRGTVPPLCP